MEYSQKIRKVLTNYPPMSKNLRVYLDPEISGIDLGYPSAAKSVITLVDKMEDADIIPVFISYATKCSDKLMNIIDAHLNKVCFSVNFIDVVNAELDLMDKDTFESIQQMLMSNDPDSLLLGLGLLRSYSLDDNDKNHIQNMILSYSPNYNGTGGTIKPLFGQVSIEIENTEVIDFYNMWLNNKK